MHMFLFAPQPPLQSRFWSVGGFSSWVGGTERHLITSCFFCFFKLWNYTDSWSGDMTSFISCCLTLTGLIDLKWKLFVCINTSIPSWPGHLISNNPKTLITLTYQGVLWPLTSFCDLSCKRTVVNLCWICMTCMKLQLCSSWMLIHLVRPELLYN